MRRLLSERYRERLAGVLSCYDRIIVTGTLPGVCYAKGMTCVSLNLIRQSLLVFEVGAGGRGAVLTPELGPRPALRHPERRRRQ